MLWVVLLLLLCGRASAAISNVAVLGSTNVQALLSYEAPSDAACSVEVSEKPEFRPLAPDVDPAVFPGADLDSRPGNLVDGRSRLFVVGQRAVDQGASGKWYSRALQTDTDHYFRIRCGDEVASGAFRTANIPVGITYPWPIPQDPKTGHFRWPSLDGNDRGQTLIDPNYGTLIKRVSLPGDTPGDIDTTRQRFRSAAGANWTDTAAALADDGSPARYTGTSRDWLVLSDSQLSGLTSFYAGALGIDSIAVRIKGSAQGDDDHRKVEVCLTLDGAACLGEIRSAVLDSSESVKMLGGGPALDLWGAETLFTDQVARNKTFGVMIRPAADSGVAIAIQYVDLDVATSGMMSMPDGGFFQVCAPVKSNGGYHCALRNSLGMQHLFWIGPETGEVRWLGKLVASGWGGPRALCATSTATFDQRDPNVYYCEASLDGKLVLLKGTYTGKDVAARAGDFAPMTWVNLTPAGSTIPELIQGFNPEYDPARFPPGLAFINGHYAVFRAWRRGQDSIAWVAAFDIDTGKVVAAVKAFAAPNARWCGLHQVEFAGHTNWIGLDAIPVTGGNNDATGPFSVTLNTELPPQTGTFTIQVSGEPQPYLLDTAAGDVFQIQGGEGFDLLRILEKRSSTEWVVERSVARTTAGARPAGSTLMAFCGARRVDMPRRASYVYWDFVNDPQAANTTGGSVVVEKELTGGHIVQRGDYRIMEADDGYAVVTPGIGKSFNQPRSFHLPGNPDWAGVRAAKMDAGVSWAYQQHETYENYAAGNGRSNWFVDMMPFVGGTSLVPSIARVAGFNQVYRVNTTRLQPDIFPTAAHCAGRQLKNISPGPIGDADQYAFCIGGGCAPGAGASDVFVNCPAPVTEKSACNQMGGGDPTGVCVADMTPYGQTITQFFLDPSGLRNRVLTNALFAWHSPRTRTFFDTAYSLPDGSWLLFGAWANNGRKDIYMVKVPQQPPFDSDPRTGSQPVTQSVSLSPPAGANEVLVQYGSNAAQLGASARQACNAGAPCTFQVTAKPLEIVFSKATFRDGGGQAVAATTQARTILGLPGSGLGKPTPAASNPVVNAFSFEPKLAPGAIASIFGQDLAACEDRAGPLPLPTTLCQASVSFSGQPGRMLYAGPGQLNVQLPQALTPRQDVEVIVDRLGSKSDPVRLPGSAFGEVAPAIAPYALGDGVVRAAVQLPDNAIAGPDRPLRPGERATIFANALGPTNPPVNDGEAAPADPPAATANTVEVYVNGVPQPVAFSGLATGLSGLYRVDFTLDPATPVLAGNDNRIWLVIKGVESPRLVVSLQGP